jgi:SAM-dependent methyltransferase
MDRFEQRLETVRPSFRELLPRIPDPSRPPLPEKWLRCEMLERFLVLSHAPVEPGARVLEVGSGSHAIATVPLASCVGGAGRVIAAELERWEHFRAITAASGMAGRIRAVACDARRLPLRGDSVDLACCVHGIRSLGEDANVVRVIREMLRTAETLFLAESLPIARTEAQRSHLAMYDLREEFFLATTGRRDDRHYRSLGSLVALVEAAGGEVHESAALDVDLPHALAYFPRESVERVTDRTTRDELLHRWDEANRLRERFGEDHPPVGVVRATRR